LLGSWPVQTPTAKVITGSQMPSSCPRQIITIENTSKTLVNAATIANTHKRRSMRLPELVRM